MADFCNGPIPDFSDLPPTHSGIYPLFLDSLRHSVPGTAPTIVSNDPYDYSCDGQQIFPSLVECLELFDRSFTSSSHIPTILADSPQHHFDPFPTSQCPPFHGAITPNFSGHLPTTHGPPSEDSPVFESVIFRTFKSQHQVPWPSDPLSVVDITSYLSMSQSRASRLLRIRPATLRKKWMEATHNRKWPYRTLKRLDREITVLSRNIQLGSSTGKMIEHFGRLLKDRESQLAPVKISFAEPL